MIKWRAIFDKIEPLILSPEAIVITGMRRTGKATVLKWAYEKIEHKNKIFIDLENPINRKIFSSENYYEIKRNLEFMGLNFTERAFIFIDEIQFVKTIPSVVKYFIDNYNAKFFLTGSASFYLKNLFTESLSGRKYIFELFPLSFKEFLHFKDKNFDINENSPVSQSTYSLLMPLYEEYLEFGGFPGVVLKESIEEKQKVLDDIFSSFYQLEIIQLGDFKRNETIRDMMLLLAQRVGTKIEIGKLSSELGVSHITVKEYLSFLEGTYFIKLLKPFSRGKDIEIRKMPKVYLCDCGLLNRISKLEKGRIFENAIFQNLRLKGELNYYQRKSGVEIDFILNKEKGYETKLKPYASDVSRLKKLVHDIGLKEFRIVSKEYTSLENTVFCFQI
ncbi:ATP-binding protein [Thermodesulfovibrio sp. 3907-1M]|uniref:ATP-binding protein n=1 Tax=Thermodesulfovibrio autotrophicus TaxID=3118333 RepID=A0AAU8GUI7_9BACT